MNTNQPLVALFASSSNPQQISTTVTGLVIGCSSVIVMLAASLFHLTLTPDNVTQLAGDLGMVAGAIWVIVGLVHKAINKFGRTTAN